MSEHLEVRSNRFPELRSAMSREMRAIADAVLEHVASDIRAKDIHHFLVEVQNGAIYIGDDPSFYAGFIEYGTTSQPARPFVTPAAEQGQQELVRDMGTLGDHVG